MCKRLWMDHRIQRVEHLGHHGSGRCPQWGQHGHNICFERDNNDGQ